MGTVRERLAREMAITVAVPPHGRETFEALADLFAHHRGDKPVTFQLLVKDQGRQLRVRAQVSAHIRVKPTSALVAGSGEDLWRRRRGASLAAEPLAPVTRALAQSTPWPGSVST